MKKEKEQKIIRRQVSKKLEEINKCIPLTEGVRSWSSYIRVALGMSVTQLAARLGVSQSSVSELEKREREGTITIKKLKDLANGVDCQLVYAFVPKVSLAETVNNQAKKKATLSIEASDTHMSLEDQQVQIEIEERLEDLIKEKMYSKYLWDENE